MRSLLILSLLVACSESEPEKAPAAAEPAAEAAPAPAEPAKPAEPAADATADAAGGDAAGGDNAAGKKVYDTYCVACHQADGTGMNGTLAGDFIADKSRLAMSDDALLASIRDGKTGTVGAMPGWSSSLSEDEMKAVLAYIRATYGG